MTKPKPIKIILIALFILLCLFALFLDHYPDYYGAIHPPPGQAYMGQVSWFDPWDMSVYISAIRWGGRDGWLFKNVYTTIDQPPAPIFHIYLLLGKIGALLQQSPQMMFHAGAIVLSIPFLLFLVYFTRYFTRTRLEWILAFFFCVLGGGLGWILYPYLPVPDVFVPGFTIETALHRPHEALSSLFYIALMLLTFKAIIANSDGWLAGGAPTRADEGALAGRNARQDPSRRNELILIGTTTFLLAFQHPYMLLPYFLVLGVFSLYILKVRPFGRSRSDLLRHLIPIYSVTLGASTLYAVLSLKLFITNPSFGGLLSQIQQSANPWMMMLGYGILAPFIVWKLVSKSSGSGSDLKGIKGLTLTETLTDTRLPFLRIWFLVQFATLYLPLGFQRLLIRGLLYPAFVLAAMGIVDFMRKKKHLALPLLFTLIPLVPLSSLYMFQRRIADIPNLNRWMYLSLDEMRAFDFLESRTPKERTVLASYRVSNHLPPHTDSWVFAGHEFQSPEFHKRQEEVQSFFAGKMRDDEAREWLRKNNIQYVFYGPEEKAIEHFESKSFLKKIYENNQAIIYQSLLQ